MLTKTKNIPLDLIYLEVKESSLPGCGKGLFTKVDVTKGDLIVEYVGENITWAQALKRNEKHAEQAPYLFYISAKNCVDAEHVLSSLARYANDAKGHTKIKGISNNSEYCIIDKKPFIKATKNIKAGDEILVSYGKEYWDALVKK